MLKRKYETHAKRECRNDTDKTQFKSVENKRNVTLANLKLKKLKRNTADLQLLQISLAYYKTFYDW